MATSGNGALRGSAQGTQDEASAAEQTENHDAQNLHHRGDAMHQSSMEDHSDKHQAIDGDENLFHPAQDLPAHAPSTHAHSTHDHFTNDHSPVDETANDRPRDQTAMRDFSKYQHRPCEPPPQDLSAAEKLAYYKSRIRSWQSIESEAFGHSLPHALHVTRGEAQHEIRDLANTIFSLWNQLNSTLQRHEGMIQKRWAKKTVAQRSALLLKVRPEINKSRRPDFRLFMQAGKTPSLQTFQPGDPLYVNAYLFPFLNLEDLAAKPRPFLLFLKSRGRNLPHVFALSDERNCRSAMGLGIMASVSLYDHTMLLQGQKLAKDYGKLYSWNEHEEALDWYLSSKGTLPRYGISVMRFQNTILRFLLQATIEVLHDIDTTVCTQAPVMPEPTLAMDLCEWTNAASISAEAAFNAPAKYDFDRVLTLATARASLALDHIFNLREDPNYFATQVFEWSEHCPERVRDVNGRPHDALSLPSANKKFWSQVLQDMTRWAYEYAWFWTWVTKKLRDLKKMDKSLLDDGAAISSLVDEFDTTLRRVRAIVAFECECLRLETSRMAKASPLLRNSYERSQRHCPCCHDEEAVLQFTGEASDELCTLFRLLDTSLGLRMFGAQGIVMQIQRLADSSQPCKAQISPLLIRVLSDLASAAELLSQLDLYRPKYVLGYVGSSSLLKNFGQGLGLDASPLCDLLKNFGQGLGSDAIPLRDLLKKFDTLHLGEVDYLKGGKFSCPAERSPSKRNVEAMQHAERNLDDFWSRFDHHFLVEGGNQNGFRVQDFMPDREIIRTEDWIEPTDRPPSHSRPDVDDEQVAASIRDRLHLERTSEDTVEPDVFEASKAKLKTRGSSDLPASVADEELVEQAGADAEEATPHFVLSKRSYKVLTWLFHDPRNGEARAGDIPWTDFLHAMTKCGFAAEKLYGSIWQLTQVDSGISIQFHEPHPDSRISYSIGRRIGRRLFRNFGWTYKSFGRA